VRFEHDFTGYYMYRVRSITGLPCRLGTGLVPKGKGGGRETGVCSSVQCTVFNLLVLSIQMIGLCNPSTVERWKMYVK